MTPRHLFASLAVASALALPFAASASTADEPGRLTVTASSEVAVAPDIATVRARLWEQTPASLQGDDRSGDPQAARDAREKLEWRMSQVITDLEQLGVRADQLSAGTLSARQHVEQRQVTRQDPQQRYVRTRVERPLTVSVDNLELIPRILDTLSEVGINAIDGVDYDLSKRERYYDAALSSAVAKARHQADLMAEGLDSELVRVLNVQQNASHRPAPMAMMRSKTMMDSAESQPAEYRAGELDISANVTVTWEIANAE